MHLIKKTYVLLFVLASIFFMNEAKTSILAKQCAAPPNPIVIHSLTEVEIAKQLGWVQTNDNRCGGYYLEPPIVYDDELLEKNLISITSDQGLFALHGTSITQGKVTITRFGQQIKANKAYIYRDSETGKTTAVDLIGDIILREPNELVRGQIGHYDFKKDSRFLKDILYRAAIYSNPKTKPTFENEDLQLTREVTQLSAWGQAHEFQQNQPKIYEFEQASYTTCPPTECVWQVKAKHITLNKITGRGTAWHSRIYLKGIPVFYSPYLNFPIDSRRQTGFLAPSLGLYGPSGPYLTTPFYWNLAPNYDDTITPSYISKRSVMVTNVFRYLDRLGTGNLRVAILPYDRQFVDFKEAQFATFQNSPDISTRAELQRLMHAPNTRASLDFQDVTHFNKHLSTDVDFNYVTDDYYLKDLGSISSATDNQLLQQADVNYKSQYWNFLGRLQGYQTLHPIGTNVFDNQYRRLPELNLGFDYPDGKYGLEYFADNDITHFDLNQTPGTPESMRKPTGNRFNTIPGISLPLNWPYLYFSPRLQFALTKYELTQHSEDLFFSTPRINNNPARALPIFDVSSNLYLDRDLRLFHTTYRQSLEPQIYYTYIPYRNQNNLPLFDTTVNTLTFDQLFTYNRFSGIDRINDANQVALGITTRFLETDSGLEKVKAGIGQIIYFQKRRVTICSDASCGDNPNTPENRSRRSPISAMLAYNVTDKLSLSTNSVINQKTNSIDNQSAILAYRGDEHHFINFTYNFVRNGDVTLPQVPGSPRNNMSQTDLFFSWMLARDWSAVGRWTENWNRKRFQNLLYGLQYDSCCWAVRAVSGRVFKGLNPDNGRSFLYNNVFFLQFALKGLGNIGNADPSHLLANGIGGYNSNFGRDF